MNKTSGSLDYLFDPRRVPPEGFVTKGLDIEVKDLFKTYIITPEIQVKALRGVSFKVVKGSLSVVIGPSGSGKTTLLNIIGCLDKPTSGSVLIDSIDVTSLNEKILEKIRLSVIGFVFQSLNLIPILSALENVALPMIAFNVPREVRIRRAKWLLNEVGLSDRALHKPFELSGGQQQRVAIAVSLANDPPIVIADEPTAELDYENAVRVMELLWKLSVEYGKTILVSTHDYRIVTKSNTVFRLEDGKLIDIYKPTEFVEVKSSKTSEITDILRKRLSRVEEDIKELVSRYSRGELSLEDFNREYSRLRNLYDALRELLITISK
ncbi:MAG: ABC transporter ATP-binding protein [Desulfurococcaceae archaeon]